MKVIQHTLISEGSTDANLIPIINWTLQEVGGVDLSEGVRAEFWRLEHPPASLTERIRRAVELYPCDVLFIHRDADRDSPELRITEIQAALENAFRVGNGLPAVAVVPVRMLEAWYLFDERAIRCAAGNPNGAMPLKLPSLQRVEDRPDPKIDLRDALRNASGLKGRRLKKFNTARAFHRVVDFVEDYSPLRQLPAYRRFADSVRRMEASNWRPGFYGSESPP